LSPFLSSLLHFFFFINVINTLVTIFLFGFHGVRRVDLVVLIVSSRFCLGNIR
jgi:hypothetical protein